jgi:molecular chaperone HscB
MARCPECAAELETPLGCAACSTLFELAHEPTPFEIFGLRASYDVDQAALRRQLLKLGRLTHPDFFATRSHELKARAEHASALLNAAHETLADDVRRADWLVHWLGGPDENELREMPKPFLLEVLEWNERLEAARASSEPIVAELDEIEASLREQRQSIADSIRRALSPLPEKGPEKAPERSSAHGSERLRVARQELNAMRYVDRALSEIEALRLSRAAAR